MTDQVWAVTCIFNPGRFRPKAENYWTFRSGIERVGVPLLTVECLFPDQSPSVVGGNVVHVFSGSVLWQKERLLNLAVEKLPADARYVAWLDCDLLFSNPQWIGQGLAALRRGARFVQLFSAIGFLGPGETELDPGFVTTQAMAANRAEGKKELREPPGGAWLADRAFFEEIGLYDQSIVGGGDTIFALAVTGEYKNQFLLLDQISTPVHQSHILAWSRRVADYSGGRVACVPGLVKHLWHGARKNRRYFDRHKILVEHDYNPDRDLQISHEGVLEWTGENRRLAGAVSAYLKSRREDG